MNATQGFYLVVELKNGKKIYLYKSSVRSSIDRLTSFFKDKKELISVLRDPKILMEINEKFIFDDTNYSALEIKDIYIENYRKSKAIEKMNILEGNSRDLLNIYKSEENLDNFIKFLTLYDYTEPLKEYFSIEILKFNHFDLSVYDQIKFKNIYNLLKLYDQELSKDIEEIYINKDLVYYLKQYLVDGLSEENPNGKINYRNLSNLFTFLKSRKILSDNQEFHPSDEYDFITYNISKIINLQSSFCFDSDGKLTYDNSLLLVKEPFKIERKNYPLKTKKVIFRKYQEINKNDEIINEIISSSKDLDDAMLWLYDKLDLDEASKYNDEIIMKKREL